MTRCFLSSRTFQSFGLTFIFSSWWKAFASVREWVHWRRTPPKTIEGRIIDLPKKGESALETFSTLMKSRFSREICILPTVNRPLAGFIHKKQSSQHNPIPFISAKYRSFCFKHPRLLSAAPDPTRFVVLGAHMNHIQAHFFVLLLFSFSAQFTS